MRGRHKNQPFAFLWWCWLHGFVVWICHFGKYGLEGVEVLEGFGAKVAGHVAFKVGRHILGSVQDRIDGAAGMMVGFERYLCLKNTMPDILVAFF